MENEEVSHDSLQSAATQMSNALSVSRSGALQSAVGLTEQTLHKRGYRTGTYMGIEIDEVDAVATEAEQKRREQICAGNGSSRVVA